MRDEDAWRLDAACRGMPADVFYLERHDSAGVANAKAVCATCPVIEPCLAYAMVHDRRFGIFGGTSPKQRQALHHAARQAAADDEAAA